MNKYRNHSVWGSKTYKALGIKAKCLFDEIAFNHFFRGNYSPEITLKTASTHYGAEAVKELMAVPKNTVIFKLAKSYLY